MRCRKWVTHMMQKKPRQYEEYAYVLDYLPEERKITRGRIRYSPIVQAIGASYFTLLELIAKPNVPISLEERVYIGKGYRDKIAHVKGKLSYSELTSTAKSELPHVLEIIVKNKERYFVNFFNKAGPITPRLHALELLPGVGKKTMWEIIEERKRKPFESFEDISNRVSIPNVIKLLAKRIEQELIGGEKYYLFVRRSTEGNR